MSKKLLLLLTLSLVMALIFTGCTKPEATPEPSQAEPVVDQEPSVPESVPEQSTDDENIDDLMVKVDPEKLVVKDELVKNGALLQASGAVNHTKENYEILRSTSYEDKWFWEYGVLYPKITDEITQAGAQNIKDYFAAKAQQAEQNRETYIDDFIVDGEIMDTASMKDIYMLQNYDLQHVGSNYMTVFYSAISYTGGAHGSQIYAVDNFELRSGEVLTLEDIFGKPEEYADKLNQLIDADLKEREVDTFEDSFDITTMYMDSGQMGGMAYRLTDTGVQFIFNEYAIAPYYVGAILVEIPYEELADIIKLDIND